MTTDNKPNVTSEVIDLLDRLLRYDHYERLTAAEALSHAYFSGCPSVMVLAAADHASRVDIVRLGTATKSADRVSDSGFGSM